MRDYERLRKTLGNLIALHDCAIDELREPMWDEAETVWNETAQTSEMERLVSRLELEEKALHMTFGSNRMPDEPRLAYDKGYKAAITATLKLIGEFGYGGEDATE